jgi:hypothetical protein
MLFLEVSARRWIGKEAPMKVFVAGATGAIGTQLVPQLAVPTAGGRPGWAPATPSRPAHRTTGG